MATPLAVALGLLRCVTLALPADDANHGADQDGALATASSGTDACTHGAGCAANSSLDSDVEHRAPLLLQQLALPTPSVKEESLGTANIQFGGCEMILARDCSAQEGDVRELVSSWEALQHGFQGCCGSESPERCHSDCCGKVVQELHNSGSIAGVRVTAKDSKATSDSSRESDDPRWCRDWAELSDLRRKLLLRAPQHADPVALTEEQQPAEGLGAVELDRAASGKAKIKSSVGKSRGLDNTASGKGDQGDADNTVERRVGKPTLDQDLLTVMTYNTNLLKIKLGLPISSEPNLNMRARHLVRWIETLQLSEVPDVLVLQDIYSAEGELLIRQICEKDWVRSGDISPWSEEIPDSLDCNARSHFKVTTSDLNVVAYFWPAMGGGVVVLLKRGLHLVSASPQRYGHCNGMECFVRYGFWAIQLTKGTEKYWLFATSVVPHETEKYQEIRQKNFMQMREYINANVKDGEKIVIAGGLNVFTGPYEDKIGRVRIPNELEGTLKTLGTAGAPASPGKLVPRGFWLPLEYDLNVTMDPVNNHFVNSIPSAAMQGPQMFDWVLVPGVGDRLATPFQIRYQVVPIKSDSCFPSERPGLQKKGKTRTDDLSDHYAVFSEIRWKSSAPQVAPVKGHRGFSGALRKGFDCNTER